jgi:hypothetical protein
VRTSAEARARKRKLLALLIPAALLVVLVASVAAVVSSGGGGGGNTRASVKEKITSAHARRAIVAPTQAAVTRGAKWVTGPANKLLTAVNTDLGNVSEDQRAGNYSAAKGAGTQLAAAARAALDGPMPPADAAVYRSALKDFQKIGTDTASGNFRAANSLVVAANLGIMRVASAADPPAPVNQSAGDNDPNDG